MSPTAAVNGKVLKPFQIARTATGAVWLIKDTLSRSIVYDSGPGLTNGARAE